MSETIQSDKAGRLKRIARVSASMKWVLTLFMLLVVLVGIIVFSEMTGATLLGLADEAIDIDGIERTYGEIPWGQRMVLALFMEFNIASFILVMFYMRRVFANFQKLDFFSSQTLNAMVWCGIWFVIFGIFDFLEEPVGSVLSTMDLAEGQRQLSIEFEGGELFLIVFGVLFITLGWVLREAALLQEENDQFI